MLLWDIGCGSRVTCWRRRDPQPAPGAGGGGASLPVAPGRSGKLRLPGWTAVGETEALHRVVEAGFFGAAQAIYNMLNPSAGAALPLGHSAQDYRQLLQRMQEARMGAVGIRVLAGGALSGSAKRHPVASLPPEPIGSGNTYGDDLSCASRLLPLVDEGFAASLPEAAIRFVIGHPAMATVLVGMAGVEEFEAALEAVLKGPLPPEAFQRLAELTASFSGESQQAGENGFRRCLLLVHDIHLAGQRLLLASLQCILPIA
jgi:aryl-alcohol dehydrogenase-like predicted oxidoreductase